MHKRIFIYKCQDCDKEFDSSVIKTTKRGFMSSSNDTVDISCPYCKSKNISKVFSGNEFNFSKNLRKLDNVQ